MKNIFFSLILLLVFQHCIAASDKEISPEQCRAASNQIIKMSEDALPMAEDKKKAKKLEKLITSWKERLKSKEDACEIYQSILKSSSSL